MDFNLWRQMIDEEHMTRDELAAAAWMASAVVEREACAEICHARYMELEHWTSRDDPADDFEAGLRSAVAEELRDAIVARS